MIYYDFNFTSNVTSEKYTILGTTKRDINKKVAVYCPICAKDSQLYGNGIFYSSKGNLLSGQICCGCSKNAKLSIEQKIIKLQRIDTEKYKFISLKDGIVNYLCSKHGECKSSVSNYIGNRRCAKCQHEKTGDRCRKGFQICINQVMQRLPEGVSYVGYEGHYIGNTTNLQLCCNVHGLFNRQIRVILGGNNPYCPSCKGRSPVRQDILYMLLFKGFGEIFLKIGISSHDHNRRVCQLENKSIFDIETLLSLKFEDMTIARKIERIILQDFDAFIVPNDMMSEGFTETKKLEDYNKIRNTVFNYITSNEVLFKTLVDRPPQVFGIDPNYKE